MVLLLAVHTLEAVTSKVPFTIIQLSEFYKNKEIPGELRLRQVLPTTGRINTTLWDAPDPALLKAWLDETFDVDCQHEVFEVTEDFSMGLPSEIARMRAAEMVSQNTRDLSVKAAAAASTLNLQVQEINQKLNVSENAQAIARAAKERGSVAYQGAAALFSRVGVLARSATSKAMENDKVAATATAFDVSFKRLGANLQQLRETGGSTSSAQEQGGLDALPDLAPQASASVLGATPTPAPPPPSQQQQQAVAAVPPAAAALMSQRSAELTRPGSSHSVEPPAPTMLQQGSAAVATSGGGGGGSLIDLEPPAANKPMAPVPSAPAASAPAADTPMFTLGDDDDEDDAKP